MLKRFVKVLLMFCISHKSFYFNYDEVTLPVPKISDLKILIT